MTQTRRAVDEAVRFTEEQIVAILKEAQAGGPVGNPRRVTAVLDFKLSHKGAFAFHRNLPGPQRLFGTRRTPGDPCVVRFGLC